MWCNRSSWVEQRFSLWYWEYFFPVCPPSQLLVLEISATPLHICLPPTSPSSHLLTACEDGLHCYNTQLGTNNTTKRYVYVYAQCVCISSCSCIKGIKSYMWIGQYHKVSFFSFFPLIRSKEMEITFPIYKKEDKDHDYHTIDGLSFLTDDIVGKWGSYSIPESTAPPIPL